MLKIIALVMFTLLGILLLKEMFGGAGVIFGIVYLVIAVNIIDIGRQRA